MIIGVDAGCLGVTDERLKVGVYQVAKNLLKNLEKIDKKNKYLLYSFNPISADLLREFGKNMENILVKPAFGWSKIWLPLKILGQNPDTFLGLSQFLPRSFTRKDIVLIYDLAFEFYPEFYRDSMPEISKMTKYAVKNANKVVAISNSTRDDLVKTYGTPKEKIIVSYLGYDEIFKHQSPVKIEEIKKKYHINKPYFLFVGALKKIKNIPIILVGFADFLKKTKKSAILVLVGGDLWLDKEIANMIKKLSLQENVVLTGYIENSDLPALYGGAMSFVSPSIYEGCGMTLIEAMACGCPVITSNISAMPEVVAEAGIFVDPKSSDEICNALKKIVNDKKLRDNLAKEGLLRTQHFSWQKFAADVLKVIRS